MSDGYVNVDGETYFCIANSHEMPDFFMSLVGSDDHWMFVSSNTALTAGRRNPDLALFPYAADDQISAARDGTGAITLVRFEDGAVWEPFASHQTNDRIRRNLYKTPLGNKLIFEEINEDRQLAFRYRWAFSRRFGIVRNCWMRNVGTKTLNVELLDGIQNVLPYGVGSDFMMRFSNLANAYKKSELLTGSNLGLYYLSSIPTDRAEPSEGLKTTVVWQKGILPKATLLSTAQIPAFRNGDALQTEIDVRGKAGAYLLNQTLEFSSDESVDWTVVAEVAQDHANVIELHEWLQNTEDASAEIAADILTSEQHFLRMLSSSDGLQCGRNSRRTNRHLSNTVFNVMRGGIPLEGYTVDLSRLSKPISKTSIGQHFNSIGNA